MLIKSAVFCIFYQILFYWQINSTCLEILVYHLKSIAESIFHIHPGWHRTNNATLPNTNSLLCTTNNNKLNSNATNILFVDTFFESRAAINLHKKRGDGPFRKKVSCQGYEKLNAALIGWWMFQNYDNNAMTTYVL